MSEVDQLDDAEHSPETMQHLERAMEKYAPAGYDPASDDLTIPFAMELVEKDRQLAALREALVQVRGFVKVMDESNWRDLRFHIERQTDVLEQNGRK